MLQLHPGDKIKFAIYLELNLLFIDDRFCLKFHEIEKISLKFHEIEKISEIFNINLRMNPVFFNRISVKNISTNFLK